MVQISNNIEVDELKNYVIEHFAKNEVDLALYADALDHNYQIDSELLKDPVFIAFWQLQAHLLKEIENPTPINSMEAQVDETHLEAAFAQSEQEYQDTIEEIKASDAEINQYINQSENQKSEANSWLSSLNTSFKEVENVTDNSGSSQGQQNAYGTMAGEAQVEVSTEPTYQYTQDAKALGDKLGLGEFFNDAVAFEEMVQQTNASVFTSLAEMDQQLVHLKEALQTGAISAQEFEADFSSISVSREALLAVLQHTSNALMTTMEMYSQLVKQAVDGALTIANNFKF